MTRQPWMSESCDLCRYIQWYTFHLCIKRNLYIFKSWPHGRFPEVVSYEGWNNRIWNFIITQIVYVIVTFKSSTCIATFSRAHIAHISTPTSLKCLGIWWGTLFSKLINIWTEEFTMIVPHITAGDWCCQDVKM